MKKIFMGTALLQVLLFVTLVFGVSKNILKNDLFVKLTKITSLVIFLLSTYIVVMKQKCIIFKLLKKIKFLNF